MKKLPFLFIAIFTTTFSFAQNFTSTTESDPEATAILEKIRTQYDAYKTIEADFSLIIEFPESDPETQKGKLWQKGDKYRAQLPVQTLTSDGETIWVYLPKANEVQVNCVDEFEGEGTISPKDLLRIYEQDDYIYYLSNEYKEDGRVIQQIEFKPADRDSEYSKLRLTVEKNTLKIVRIKAFSKDGSRFTLKMDNFKTNQTIDESKFIWSDKDCSDCYVEDLRIDCE